MQNGIFLEKTSLQIQKKNFQLVELYQTKFESLKNVPNLLIRLVIYANIERNKLKKMKLILTKRKKQPQEYVHMLVDFVTN